MSKDAYKVKISRYAGVFESDTAVSILHEILHIALGHLFFVMEADKEDKDDYLRRYLACEYTVLRLLMDLNCKQKWYEGLIDIFHSVYDNLGKIKTFDLNIRKIYKEFKTPRFKELIKALKNGGVLLLSESSKKIKPQNRIQKQVFHLLVKAKGGRNILIVDLFMFFYLDGFETKLNYIVNKYKIGYIIIHGSSILYLAKLYGFSFLPVEISDVVKNRWVKDLRKYISLFRRQRVYYFGDMLSLGTKEIETLKKFNTTALLPMEIVKFIPAKILNRIKSNISLLFV